MMQPANDTTAFANLFKYKSDGSIQFVRTIHTTNEKIDQQILKALDAGPVQDAYRFDLFNSDHESVGSIFTDKTKLFD